MPVSEKIVGDNQWKLSKKKMDPADRAIKKLWRWDPHKVDMRTGLIG